MYDLLFQLQRDLIPEELKPVCYQCLVQMENTWRLKLGCLCLLAGLIVCIFLMVVIIKFINFRHRNQVLILESGHRHHMADETSRADRLERIVRRLHEEKKEWENKKKKEEQIEEALITL
uniref:Uncharacterized protein n=1 Tax=Strongyloides venezuelensis TaxID=75913 RepID=A0A0K0FT99_STRVS